MAVILSTISLKTIGIISTEWLLTVNIVHVIGCTLRPFGTTLSIDVGI